jgi:hypothetical protein
MYDTAHEFVDTKISVKTHLRYFYRNSCDTVIFFARERDNFSLEEFWTSQGTHILRTAQAMAADKRANKPQRLLVVSHNF